MQPGIEPRSSSYESKLTPTHKRTRYPSCHNMSSSKDLVEAEQLLSELGSWTEEEIEQLPRLYRLKAKKYRRLTKTGQE